MFIVICINLIALIIILYIFRSFVINCNFFSYNFFTIGIRQCPHTFWHVRCIRAHRFPGNNPHAYRASISHARPHATQNRRVILRKPRPGSAIEARFGGKGGIQRRFRFANGVPDPTLLVFCFFRFYRQRREDLC